MRIAHDIIELLMNDEGISSSLSSAPEAFILPFMKSSIDEYVIIWIYLHDHSAILESIWEVIGSAITLTAEHGKLEEMKGIEVVPCLTDAEIGADRILRLCVHKWAIDACINLLPHDLLNEQPTHGVTCGWYWDPERTLGPIHN